MYPSPHKLGVGVLGYLFLGIGVATAIGVFSGQVLLSLPISVLENSSANFVSCSCTSTGKLGLMNANMNFGVLKIE